MKARHLIILGLFISFISLFITAAKEENGDGNAIGMYFIVFLIPVIIIVLFNAVFISSLNNQKLRNRKIILSFIPVIFLLILNQLKNMQLNLLDGSISFVGLVGAIGVGLTNIIWIFSLFRDDENKVK